MALHRSAPALTLLVCLLAAGPASAQSPAGRFEVSAHAALLRLSDFGGTNPGIGGRLTFDLSKWASVEGEVNYFPNDELLLPVSVFAPAARVSHVRRRADAFFGLKVGTRGRRLGAFLKARPGLARLTNVGVACVGEDCARMLMLFAQPDYRTEFALDFGGGIEFYPSARTVARFEIGDTMIRHRSFAPPCWGSQCTSHNLSSRLGVGFRF